jgi:hypothetical protein
VFGIAKSSMDRRKSCKRRDILRQNRNRDKEYDKRHRNETNEIQRQEKKARQIRTNLCLRNEDQQYLEKRGIPSSCYSCEAGMYLLLVLVLFYLKGIELGEKKKRFI